MDAAGYKEYAFGWRPKDVLLRNLRLQSGRSTKVTPIKEKEEDA